MLRRHGAVHRKARAGHLSPSRVIGTTQICRLRHWAVGQSNGCCQLHGLQFLNHRHCSECQGSARAEWLAKGVVYSIRFTAAAETLRITISGSISGALKKLLPDTAAAGGSAATPISHCETLPGISPA